MPPCIQKTSFDSLKDYIKIIASELTNAGIPFVVSPSKLALKDYLFYDTPYHLNARGYPVRTKIVIDSLLPLFRFFNKEKK